MLISELITTCIDCPRPAVDGQTRCISCRNRQRKYRQEHLEDHKTYMKEYHSKEDVIRRNEYGRIRAREIRVEVLQAYGGKCVQCGENRFPCLEMDHINNDGAQHRKEMKINGGSNALTQWLKRNNFPSGFQILCGNCHRMKHYRRFQDG